MIESWPNSVSLSRVDSPGFISPASLMSFSLRSGILGHAPRPLSHWLPLAADSLPWLWHGKVWLHIYMDAVQQIVVGLLGPYWISVSWNVNFAGSKHSDVRLIIMRITVSSSIQLYNIINNYDRQDKQRFFLNRFLCSLLLICKGALNLNGQVVSCDLFCDGGAPNFFDLLIHVQNF